MGKIKFNCEELLPQLQTAMTMVNQKNSLSILDNFCIKVIEDEPNVVKIYANDGDAELCVNGKLIESEGDVAFCVNAKNFLSAINDLGDRITTIDIDYTKMMIKGTFNGGEFALPIIDSEEFPNGIGCNIDSDTAHNATIDGEKLLNAVDMVGFATSTNELRKSLTGICFDFISSNTLAIVASDGFRLARYINENVQSKLEERTYIVVSSKSANTLKNILRGYEQSVNIIFNKDFAIFAGYGFTLSTRLIVEKFPKYESIIPSKETTKSIVVNKKEILASMKFTLPFGDQKVMPLLLKYDSNVLSITSKNIDYSTSATTTISANNIGKLQDGFTIGFGGTNIMSCLQQIKSENIEMMFIDGTRCAMFAPYYNNDEECEKGISYINLSMPMLVK